jgi:cytochrome c oxidase subunit 2
LACGGAPSALTPASPDAERIATLYWWMAAGALVIWAAVTGLALFYGRPHEPRPSRQRDWSLIVGGGVVIPVVVLTGLLVYGLGSLPDYLARAPEGSLTIDVVGRQWWWDVRYRPPGGGEISVANEVRLPVGEPVQFRLASDNVIHSFWVPALGGKMDMIPGRVTSLRLQPTRTGTFMGVCAEYCGTSHALMRFLTVVMEHDAFAAWLERQASPAAEPTTDAERLGRDALVANGCGACHRVRGTVADGIAGPDLTHVAGRLTIGAGTRPTTGDHLREWVADAERTKPGVHLPAFDMLPTAELDAIALYLESLR